MKIISQELTDKTSYYAIYAEMNDETEVEATLIITDDFTCPEYELIIINCKRELTEKEKEQLEEIAIEQL